MDFSWDRYYNITKKLTLLTGQWPYQNKRDKIFGLGLTILALITINIPQVAKINRCNKELDCILGVLPIYTLVLIIMSKMYIPSAKNNEIKTLANHMRINWRELQTQEEYDIMSVYIANTRWILIRYFSISALSTVVFMSVPLIPHVLDIVLPLNESRPIVLLYEGYYFVDEKEYFFYIYFQSNIASNIAVLAFLAYDSLFIMFVEHLCGIFTVVGNRLNQLVNKDTNAIEIIDNDLDETYVKKMAHSVNLHWAAFEFADNLENIYSINFGIELILMTMIISITLFQITMKAGDTIQAIKYMIYATAQLVHLFVFCWEGQRLIDHSSQVRENMYNCGWYKKPPKSQKLILHVLERTLRSKSLTAGRMFIFSLEGFTTVVQTSMSYFTVLTSVQ